MHKLSSLCSLPIYPFSPIPASLFASLFPHSEFTTPERSCRPRPPLSLFSLLTLAPFSYPLILSQPFSLRKRRSAIHPSSSFFSLSFSIFLFYVSLFLFLAFFKRCSRTLHFLVNVLFPSRFSRIRENPCALGFFSITPFPIEHYPLHALSWRAVARLPII